MVFKNNKNRKNLQTSGRTNNFIRNSKLNTKPKILVWYPQCGCQMLKPPKASWVVVWFLTRKIGIGKKKTLFFSIPCEYKYAI
jgi:hypothetical protein